MFVFLARLDFYTKLSGPPAARLYAQWCRKKAMYGSGRMTAGIKAYDWQLLAPALFGGCFGKPCARAAPR